MEEFLAISMFVVACGLLMAGYPVAFTLAGTGLAFAFIGDLLNVFSLSDLGAYPLRVYKNAMHTETLIVVPMFIFMGVVLERSKIAEELLETMALLFTKVRGGLLISVTLVGALLAASTGIVGATVVTMGLLSLPTMLRYGYDKRLATGSICATGTLGQIIPPSIVLVLLADQLSNAYQEAQLAMGNFSPETLSVGDLFAGALFPGLMLVGLYLIYQIGMAYLRPNTAPPLPYDEIMASSRHGNLLIRVLKALVPPIILIFAVLGSILMGIASPTEAASVGAIGALLLAGDRLGDKHSPIIIAAGISFLLIVLLSNFFDLRVARDMELISTIDMIMIGVAAILTLILLIGTLVATKRCYDSGILSYVVKNTMSVTSMVFVILIGAGVFSLVFIGLDGKEMVAEYLGNLPGGVVGAMIVVMLVMFLLGFFLDFIEITFVVIPIVGPILLAMDVNPIWLGIMMAVNLQTSFLTPPFGFALFYLRGVAPDNVTTKDIYMGVIPFIGLQVLGLIILALFPDIVTYLPSVIYG